MSEDMQETETPLNQEAVPENAPEPAPAEEPADAEKAREARAKARADAEAEAEAKAKVEADKQAALEEAGLVSHRHMSNHVVLGWLMDRVNSHPEAEKLRMEIIAAIAASKDHGLLEVVDNLKAYIEGHDRAAGVQ